MNKLTLSNILTIVISFISCNQLLSAVPVPVDQPEMEFRKPTREIKTIVPGYIWIDAEDFKDYGGWRLDTQFTHLMGSGYLIASGIGIPVKDAMTEIQVPASGSYRVWVRAKNWIKDHAPGQFTIAVGNATSQKVFGKANTEEWIWEQAGDFDLKEGRATVTIKDLTGYYGRCDAIILATNHDYTPPSAMPDIQKERSRLTGISLEPKDCGEFDVIVAGAGTAGSCAAIAAARRGAKTALIQNRPVLGGNSSIELGVPVNGAASTHPDSRESGIIEEAGRIRVYYKYPKMDSPFRIMADAEKNLTVFTNRHVFAADMNGNDKIAAVKAMDTLSNEIYSYRAKYFIDCTGDGWVGFFAGAKYRLGREARSEFDEKLAPEQEDKITMSGCIMGRRALSYRAENTGKPASYTPPPWAAKLPSGDDLGRNPKGFIGGQWWLEHEGTIDDLYDAEKARDELIRITYGYWNFIKNEWPERDKAANYILGYIPIMDAKRETRRLVGDYILNENDVETAKQFDDAVSYGGWPLDVHHPKGIYSGKEGPYHCTPHVPIYTIPFRSLYSTNIVNLLFAGRNMSVTHMALGTVRVEGTLAAVGQAAGTAAALCVQKGITPRDLYSKHMKEFQQTLLKDDQYIPGLINEDPADLARTAKITASSTARYELFDQQRVNQKESHPLNMPRAVMFPRGMLEKIETISLFVGSERKDAVELELHLRGSEKFEDFSSATDITTAKASVPAEKKSRITFLFNKEVKTPYIWLWLPKTEGIEWHLMDRAPLGSCRAYLTGKDKRWNVVKGQYYYFRTKPAMMIPLNYVPENVTSGTSRPIGEVTHQWASSPEKDMPQWIELAFDTPTQINTVYLTFDTDMNTAVHDEAMVPRCVRDYELSINDGNKWQTVTTINDNFQRRRIHRFSTMTAQKIKLTTLATNGDKSARVFEIRAYKE